MIIEVWKDVKGYEGLYRVSNLGRCKSLERRVGIQNGFRIKKESILKGSQQLNGYIHFSLSKNDQSKGFRSHRIIAKSFIPSVKGKNMINHKNGIKNDNRIENLEWVNGSENNIHAVNFLGKKNINRKLNNNQVLEIYNSGNSDSSRSLATKYGVAQRTILLIRNGKTYKEITGNLNN